MPYWTDMTLSQLRYATKADILRSVGEYIAAHFTKRQILHWLLDAERFEDRPNITYRPDRQISRREVIERDVLNTVVGSREAIYSYYDTGEVEDITLIEWDAEGNETNRRVIHHRR